MLNYEVEPRLLAGFVPVGTELDSWNGKTFVSLVGFRFLKTRVFGVAFPFHCNFDEVNLRFYVQRRAGAEVRRGVVFVREIVPRRAIATVARAFYGERYLALPMSHRIQANDADVAVEYGWRFSQRWNRIHLTRAEVARSRQTALPSSSSLNTIGDTLRHQMEAALNIGCGIRNGRCGARARQASMGAWKSCTEEI